jgi:hypothetical protein
MGSPELLDEGEPGWGQVEFSQSSNVAVGPVTRPRDVLGIRQPVGRTGAPLLQHQRARIRSTAAFFFALFARMRRISSSHAVSARRVSSR